MQRVHKAWLVQAALSKQAVGMLDRPGDGSHHPTKSQHKDLLVTCPAFSHTGNCCCRWTAGLLHGHNWINFTCRVKTLLPKCVTYIQNVSCTAHRESSAHCPAGQGPSTAENLHPGPQAGPSGTADRALDSRKPPESYANPSHCYQTQNCLG